MWLQYRGICDNSRLQRQRTSTVLCSKKHRQGRAGQSPTHLSLTKKKSRAAKEPNFLLKDHKLKIRTSAVTEIKDFEQQREPCCFAIKTKTKIRTKRNTPKRLCKAIREFRGVVTLPAAQTNYSMFPVRLEWSFFCDFAARSRISPNIITNPDSSFWTAGIFCLIRFTMLFCLMPDLCDIITYS